MSGPWYGKDSQRLRFELDAKKRFPSLRSSTTTRGESPGRHYSAILAVPNYESRQVEILFRRSSPRVAKVRADGTEKSPHRFGDGCLCMWNPADPRECRWVLEDGLTRLLGLTAVHLFREAWWRETGEWLGPEAPHASDAPKVNAA